MGKGVPGLRGSVDKCSPTIVIEFSPSWNINKIFIQYLGDGEEHKGPLPTYPTLESEENDLILQSLLHRQPVGLT